MIKRAHKEELERKKREEEEKKAEKEAERDKKMEQSIMALPEEPAEGDPDITTIQFRSADGTKNFTRRFLKHHKIKALYDYVQSLGIEAGFEEEHAEFELMQNFPRMVFDDKAKTLEEEKLCP